MTAERTYDNYETMLNERFDGSTIDENKKGLARELARMNLTLNTYTQWYWKTDLLNLMNFLRLKSRQSCTIRNKSLCRHHARHCKEMGSNYL